MNLPRAARFMCLSALVASFLPSQGLLAQTALDPVTTAYAGAYGLTEQEASQRLILMHQAIREAATITDPDFSGVKFGHSNGLSIEFMTAGNPSSLASHLAKNPNFKARQVPRSSQALARVSENIANTLARRGFDFEGSTDIVSGRITFFIVGADKARGSIEGLMAGNPFVEIADVAAMPQPSATIRGSLQATGTTLECTTGFGATRAGVAGFLTAGHCDNTVTVGGISFAIPAAAAEIYTGDYDVQFHTKTGHTYKGEIYTGDNVLPIMAIRTAQVGALGLPVCRYGWQAPRQTCGTIEELAASVRNPKNGTTGTYVRVRNFTANQAMNQGGDSGGPVFGFEGAAFGLVTGKGVSGSAYQYDMYYMPISRITQVGATLITCPASNTPPCP